MESINSHAQNPAAFVQFAEAEYCAQIAQTAADINAMNKPIVLIAGPSGSGKTVTAHRLRAELENLGHRTHIISMDNYFMPLKSGLDGVDLESPDRLDRALFSEQAEKILAGEEVILPIFDFTNQGRSDGAAFRRGEGEVVIFEGIHMLNPLISGNLSENAASVYVSVRTRITDNDTVLHPSKIRLLRRFVRDKLYRGRDLLQTIQFFDNVERGEKSYIMPFKHLADFDIDTFIAYETCIYKKHVLPDLTTANSKPDNPIIAELTAFLRQLADIADELVPNRSPVREFIGGNELMNSE